MSHQPIDPHVRLLDDARQAEAVAHRSQRRLFEEADEQDATLVGWLLDAAEADVSVVLETTVGRRVRGSIRTLAGDHVVVAAGSGTTWVRLAAVTVVRTTGSTGPWAGGSARPDRPAVALADALRVLVERRSDVELAFDGGASVRGTAVAAGRDLLTLREPTTGERTLVHLARVAVATAHGCAPTDPSTY